MKKLTIATRGSKLALWQANHIKSLLEDEHGITVEILVLKTKGDIILDVPLAKVGGKGLFVKEIEEALLDGRADIAVHSMKDVPMELPEGLTLGAIPKRETPEDLLLSVWHDGIESLPKGARVGTSSLRRQAQILAIRPDLHVLPLRGNVDTRLRKLQEGDFDAIIMAAAGVNRLGLKVHHMLPLSVESFLPAVGQGALGIEFKSDRTDLAELLQFLNHERTRICVTAERAFLAELNGGCQVPIAAYATLPDALDAHDQDLYSTSLVIEGLVADIQGKRIIRKRLEGSAGAPYELGISLASAVNSAGGDAILREIYEAPKNE